MFGLFEQNWLFYYLKIFVCVLYFEFENYKEKNINILSEEFRKWELIFFYFEN